MGAKIAFYRVVVSDSRSPRDGRFIDEIGIYNPTKDPAIIEIDTEKALKWIETGAQPSDTVKSLFKKQEYIISSNIEGCSSAELVNFS